MSDAEQKLNDYQNSREVKDAIRDEQQQITRQRDLEKQLLDAGDWESAIGIIGKRVVMLFFPQNNSGRQPQRGQASTPR